MNKTPLVSICCITYNHGRYIRQCLDGLIMQKTTFAFEILIHDDASTDETQAVIREYQKKYPSIIKPIFQTDNQYSKGLRHINFHYNFPRALGKYFALCEGDDYWTDPLKLQKQVEFLEEGTHENVIFSFHNAKTLTGKSKFGDYFSFDKKYLGIIPNRVFAKYGGGGYATASAMFRRQMVEEVPGYFNIGAPGDFCLSLLAISKGEIGYIGDTMCVYRLMSVGSWSSNTNKAFKLLNNTKVLETLEAFHRHTEDKYREVCRPLLQSIYRKRVNYLRLGAGFFETVWIAAKYLKKIGPKYAVAVVVQKFRNNGKVF